MQKVLGLDGAGQSEPSSADRTGGGFESEPARMKEDGKQQQEEETTQQGGAAERQRAAEERKREPAAAAFRDQPMGLSTATMLGDSPRAIFTYGTLRADYSPTGDRWGVMEAINAAHRVGCEWRRASVQGWSLFQERGKDYPFACPATEGSVVWGTLLTWSSDDAFADALRRCDRIEGFVPGGDGLYAREVVAAESPDGVVKAYMYYQDYSSVEKMAHCLAFPEGDWLLGSANRKARSLEGPS
jgi:gamma-glutamylcyclotransferase (GGCT)/AIG2-like uncharacterized protein YtfP